MRTSPIASQTDPQILLKSQILDAHPRLTREAVLAALAFAKDALRADVLYPVAEAAV